MSTENKINHSNEVSEELCKQAEEFADKMERRGCGAWRGLRLGFIAGKQHQSNTITVSDEEVNAEVERYIKQFWEDYQRHIKLAFKRAVKWMQEKQSNTIIEPKKVEELDKAALDHAELKSINGVDANLVIRDFLAGANWQKQYASSIHEEKFSQLLEHCIFYSKSEKICQEGYFDELGIPSGQTFEQRVTAVIRMLLEYQRQGLSDEEIEKLAEKHCSYRYENTDDPYSFNSTSCKIDYLAGYKANPLHQQNKIYKNGNSNRKRQ